MIVAGKEFRDHLTSKRFLIIFIILMLLSIISMTGGMDQYNKNLESYKTSTAQNSQQQWYKDEVASLQKQIADAQAKGASAEEIQGLQYQLNQLTNPPMPSVLFVFNELNNYFMLIGGVLAIAMGFDLISREKEDGSLKSLLSHPLYRDSIINGKYLGALAVLLVVMASVFLVTIALMLFYGVVPTGDDLARILAYFLLALLYCGVFFSIAILTSTIAKSSAMSILYVLGIVLVLLMVPQFSYQIANVVMGPPPEQSPIPVAVQAPGTSNGTAVVNGNDTMPQPNVKMAPFIGWNPEIQQYYQKQQMIIDSINTISPLYDFGQQVSMAILSKAGGIVPLMDARSGVYRPITHDPTLLDSLSSVWTNILALIIELILPLVGSYILFMRMDVR